MFLGRVQGHIVSTVKDPAMSGQRLLIVEPLKVAYPKRGQASFEVTGRAIVCLDSVGAGEGQLVMITQGSSARMAEGCSKMPTDAVVVGIVDEAHVAGKKLELAS